MQKSRFLTLVVWSGPFLGSKNRRSHSNMKKLVDATVTIEATFIKTFVKIKKIEIEMKILLSIGNSHEILCKNTKTVLYDFFLNLVPSPGIIPGFRDWDRMNPATTPPQTPVSRHYLVPAARYYAGAIG